MRAFILLAASFLPHDRYVRDSVDLVEVNHFHDEQARLVFVQLIWWDWVPWQSEYRVVDWRLLKSPWARPRRVGPVWRSRWYDTADKCWREVTAASMRETWTQHDPELCDRRILPQERRQGLRKSRKKR